MTEVELAKVVVSWLKDWGWEVYQEVGLHRGGRRVDIIAVIEPKIWFIECKMSYGMKVLEQAFRWINSAHYVSVAVPYTREFSDNCLARKLHSIIGLGLIQVSLDDADEIISPRFNRKANTKRVLNALCEEHKHFTEAGSNYGGYFTAFAGTKKRFIQIVKSNPGISMKEILKKMGDEHHYASTVTAKTALAMWVRKGIIPEVNRVRDGRFIKYYPAKKAPTASTVVETEIE